MNSCSIHTEKNNRVATTRAKDMHERTKQVRDTDMSVCALTAQYPHVDHSRTSDWRHFANALVLMIRDKHIATGI
jgi:hypothetical protein